MTTALLVIDVQQSFMHRPFWRADDVPDFIARLQQLIDRCAARDIPVVQVFHEQEKEGPNGPFSRYSGLVKTLQELRIDPVAVFHKSVHSAMFARAADGQTLEQWLRARGCGVREMTSGDAIEHLPVQQHDLLVRRVPGGRVSV